MCMHAYAQGTLSHEFCQTPENVQVCVHACEVYKECTVQPSIVCVWCVLCVCVFSGITCAVHQHESHTFTCFHLH